MKYVAAACVGLVGWPVEAWLFMVAVGAVRGEWLPDLPTVDYASALLVTLAVDCYLSARAAFKQASEGVMES